MTAQSPSAYLSSATVHAAAVVLLIGAAWVARQQIREPVKIFDLVAGGGTTGLPPRRRHSVRRTA
jgi:hypothetical protein